MDTLRLGWVSWRLLSMLALAGSALAGTAGCSDEGPHGADGGVAPDVAPDSTDEEVAGTDDDEPQVPCTVDGVPHDITVEHFGITEEGLVPSDCPELGMTIYTGIEGRVHLASLEDGFYLATAGEGGGCVAATGEEHESTNDVVLARLDTFGEVEWARRYGDERSSGPGSLAAHEDGTALFVTYSAGQDEPAASHVPIFTMLDPQGQVVHHGPWPLGEVDGWAYVAARPSSDVHEFVVLGLLADNEPCGGEWPPGERCFYAFIAWWQDGAFTDQVQVLEGRCLLTSVVADEDGGVVFAGEVHDGETWTSLVGAVDGTQALVLLEGPVGGATTNAFSRATCARGPNGDVLLADLGPNPPEAENSWVGPPRRSRFSAEGVAATVTSTFLGLNMAIAATDARTVLAATQEPIAPAVQVVVGDEYLWTSDTSLLADTLVAGDIERPPSIALSASRSWIAGRNLPGGAYVLRLDAWGHGTCGAAGACRALTFGDCADGDPCTVTGCEPALGCVQKPPDPVEVEAGWGPAECVGRQSSR